MYKAKPMLHQKKCTPCRKGAPALAAEQVNEWLREVAWWALVEDGKALERRFGFKDFAGALAFVNRVGEVADSEGHHPDITLGWGYAGCLLTTHDMGGLSENDFIMASKINNLIDIR